MGMESACGTAEATSRGLCPATGTSFQRSRIVAMAIVASVHTNRSPMHLRLPAPNGM